MNTSLYKDTAKNRTNGKKGFAFLFTKQYIFHVININFMLFVQKAVSC